MKDRIDERNEREKIAKSIVKFWNVNYIPTPQYEEPPTVPEEPVQSESMAEHELEHEGAYNITTGSYSGEYGRDEVKDEVTKGQIDKILSEKTDAIRSLFEQNGERNGEQE